MFFGLFWLKLLTKIVKYDIMVMSRMDLEKYLPIKTSTKRRAEMYYGKTLSIRNVVGWVSLIAGLLALAYLHGMPASNADPFWFTLPVFTFVFLSAYA